MLVDFDDFEQGMFFTGGSVIDVIIYFANKQWFKVK